MCGPEGHAEGQRDDGGVDGPRALDGHLGGHRGMPLRLLAHGSATTTVHPRLRWRPVSCTPDGCPIPCSEENPIRHAHRHRRDAKLHVQSGEMDVELADGPEVARTVSMAAEQRLLGAAQTHRTVLAQVATVPDVISTAQEVLTKCF